MTSVKDKLNPQLTPLSFLARVLGFMSSRLFGFKLMNSISKRQVGKKSKDLNDKTVYVKRTNGGPDVRVKIYRLKENTEKLPVLLYLHGGGYAVGSPEENVENFKMFMKKRPCVIVAPGYRKSMEKPYPAAFDDGYDTLLWVRDNADSFNGDASKIMIAGHSAGGGLKAALTLKARDTKDVNIALQMPIYPMIDDRFQNESSHFDSPVWSSKSNHLGWGLYLKDLREQNKEIPTYAAPARNTDYSDFPPTFTFVGGCDPFRDETIQYVQELKKAKIPVDFKLFDGCYHGFEIIDPKKDISKKATAFLEDTYAIYYDKYVK